MISCQVLELQELDGFCQFISMQKRQMVLADMHSSSDPSELEKATRRLEHGLTENLRLQVAMSRGFSMNYFLVVVIHLMMSSKLLPVCHNNCGFCTAVIITCLLQVQSAWGYASNDCNNSLPELMSTQESPSRSARECSTHGIHEHDQRKAKELAEAQAAAHVSSLSAKERQFL